MEEELIEDSMNMETEEVNLQNKVQQLEHEVKRLKMIIRDERTKNKELELALSHYQKLDYQNKVSKNKTYFSWESIKLYEY